jgi:hypothetical protein
MVSGIVDRRVSRCEPADRDHCLISLTLPDVRWWCAPLEETLVELSTELANSVPYGAAFVTRFGQMITLDGCTVMRLSLFSREIGTGSCLKMRLMKDAVI